MCVCMHTHIQNKNLTLRRDVEIAREYIQALSESGIPVPMIYSSPSLSVGDTFHNPPGMLETTDSTKPYFLPIHTYL